MASAERSGIWNWCGRLSALDQPSVLRARAVTYQTPSGSRTDFRILLKAKLVRHQILLLDVLDRQPSAVVVIVVIVLDRRLTGDLLHDLIIPVPLNFAWRWIAVVQADQLDVLADGRVDVAGVLVDDRTSCRAEGTNERIYPYKCCKSSMELAGPGLNMVPVETKSTPILEDI
uniref:Uncharacterized protein n=1 Tax=Anopheles farauti TaxID=69004 RepID=A0A182QE60_9DIPT